MKHARKTLLSALALLGLQLAFAGCVGEVQGGGVEYGGGPWFHDDVWVDGGPGWYGRGGGYVHPGGGWRR